MTMTKQKIAIACQGGGSQTAFTAGVLSSLLKQKVHEKKEIVGLSGCSCDELACDDGNPYTISHI